ncbi:methyl-accepting chemotaxis protein [Halalkalibacterium ligniniphilum]|uniref:methyl-accepting chemotaxis protein n=1 Tax=Halalkalibacterium ligniniphilum TaxID=1134413 RepID=UPI000346D2BA|nr:methyl-accepting chemotaxis protein [Halalkalibacterium ligniniphilum]
MSTKLQTLIDWLPIIKETYPEDACLCVIDTEEVLAFLPGEIINLKVKVGTKISELKGTIIYEALIQEQRVRGEVGPEKYGVAYISTGTPIYENGKVIGAFSAIISNQKMDAFRQGAQNLTAVVEEMTATTEEAKVVTQNTHERLQKLSQESEKVRGEILKVQEVLNSINMMSVQSNILGINASIEAARAGELGKGFSVVAKEIQKMSTGSKEATANIQKQLDLVKRDIEYMNEWIQEVSKNTEAHAESMNEFHSAFSQISETTAMLHEQIALKH